MQKFLLTIFVFFVLGIAFWYLNWREKLHVEISENTPTSLEPTPPPSPSSSLQQEERSSSDFLSPLDRASERVTKKEFGTFVTPKNSPVQPERFQGYHTGVDFEIFPEELNSDVSVQAVCEGDLVMKKYATGYGGVVVQSCTHDKQPLTVVYGHLKLSSIEHSVGEKITKGERLGILGADKSSETDGERKHLHLGFHRGTGINILGYVQSKNALSEWIDPCLLVCGKE